MSGPPKVLSYSLRFTNLSYDLLHFCYNSVQNQLERGFIDSLVTTDLPTIWLGGFYYVQSIEDVLPAVLKSLLPLVLVLTTFYTANNIIKVSQLDYVNRFDCAYQFVVPYVIECRP